MEKREPIFNVPWAVSAWLAVIVGIHALRSVLAEANDEWLVLAMAFIPARYAGLAAELPGGSLAMVTSPATHMLVHGDIVHLVLNAAWLLAFGSAIGRRIGSWKFLAFSLFCGVAGALGFYLAHPGLLVPVVGASGALSGLMAAALRCLLSAVDQGGLWYLRENPQSIILTPLREALLDKRLVGATLIWLLLNVLAIYGVGTARPVGGIAWEAHVGGFLAGLLGFGVFDLKSDLSSQSHNKPTYH